MTQAVGIEPASASDCRAIADVHVTSWRAAYRGIVSDAVLAALSVEEREAHWRAALAQPASLLLAARVDGAIVGFLCAGASRDSDAPSDQAEIQAFYVAPCAWSCGVGRGLWLEARRRLAARGHGSIGLWILVGNGRAARFYERAGFTVDPPSLRSFELGGATLREVRYLRGID